MRQIQIFNQISPLGLQQFMPEQYQVSTDAEHPDAILLRSHALQLNEVADSVKAVGRAGAGVNNIPVSDLTKRGIPVFNTPGANANAVKELVVAGLLLSSRNICQAWSYTHGLDSSGDTLKKQVESGKKQFKGIELPGRTLGVIGLGAIGVKVANSALALGMRVVGFDPKITVKHAWKLSAEVNQAASLDDLLRQSQFVSLHVPLTEDTKGLIDADSLKKLAPGSTVLNFARAEIVDEKAVLAALEEEHLRAYVCDFPSAALKHQPRMIALPHLGASTIEAEDNCAVMVSEQVKEYLEQGNITNAVNFPDIYLPRMRKDSYRLAVANANVPNMVAQISGILAADGLNILDMLNKSQESVAYSLLDIDAVPSDKTLDKIKAIEGVLMVRRI